METVFSTAFEFLPTISVPIFCITIVAVADEIFYLLIRSVKAGKERRRYQ